MFPCHFSNAYWVDPLDRLSELVVNLFSPIPNRGQIPLPSFPDHPFGPDERGVSSTLTLRLYDWLDYLGDRPSSAPIPLWTIMRWKYLFR
jgi:hypothetical protein